ncbi:MAG: HD domain-containing protein [Bacteriovoracaceae bacterium]|nr:HD domain-containing protein [Bacteriovoracaceae bacterium]
MIFVPIRISTLKSEVPFVFDLYLKMKDKYVLYIKRGDDIRTVRLSKLKENKVRQMFIPEEQELEYQNYLDQSLTEAAHNVMMSSEEKAHAANGYSTQAADEIQQDPGSKKSYVKAEKAAKGIVEILTNNNDVLKTIFKNNLPDGQEGNSELMIKHSVNVATLAVKFGEISKFKKSVLENFGMAGLFHDVGLTRLGIKAVELMFKPYENFGPDDWAIYKAHPREATSILQDKEYVSKEVLDLIKQHEEKKSGDGFPEKITKLSIEQQSFNLCCHYSRQVVCLKITPAEVLKNLMLNDIGNYELKTLNLFKEMLQKEGLF